MNCISHSGYCLKIITLLSPTYAAKPYNFMNILQFAPRLLLKLLIFEEVLYMLQSKAKLNIEIFADRCYYIDTERKTDIRKEPKTKPKNTKPFYNKSHL